MIASPPFWPETFCPFQLSDNSEFEISAHRAIKLHYKQLLQSKLFDLRPEHPSNSYFEKSKWPPQVQKWQKFSETLESWRCTHLSLNSLTNSWFFDIKHSILSIWTFWPHFSYGITLNLSLAHYMTKLCCKQLCLFIRALETPKIDILKIQK